MPDRKFDAVIFDLDGVITNTASVHSTAWKQMFDEFLQRYYANKDVPFIEFTHSGDYLPFVDGKPRYKGVASFLASRNIDLPYGAATDSPQMETICGLGNRKDYLFNESIGQGNIEIFYSTVEFIKELLDNNIRVGVASSSKNCKKVLETSRLSHLFETRVDGLVSAELGLKGKPEPDIFTTACDNLGVYYDRAVVVEDAVSGVQAGYNGQFGLVLGIAREDNEQELKINGADIVVRDMSLITLDDVDNWFIQGLHDEQWALNYYDYNPEKECTREALCTIGNGYLGTRGAIEESKANGINYPGTYLAGLYNRLTTKIADRNVVNEDFVNCPNWLPITFKIGDGEWFDLNKFEICEFERHLDFRDGTLHRKIVVKDNNDNETLIETTRIVSMAEKHLAGIQYTMTPINYKNKITICSELDGQVTNSGVQRYKQLNSKHWQNVDQNGDAGNSFILVKTNQSKVELALAAKLLVKTNDQSNEFKFHITKKSGNVCSTVQVQSQKNQPITVEKIVAIYTSRECKNPLRSAKSKVDQEIGFAELHEKSKKAWSDIWKKIDIRIEGQRLVQKLVRLNLYHSIITASPHNAQIDAGIPARGLHGEAYRGHIFWDELFILPLYFMHFPETTKSVLMYRYHRLDKARSNAKEHGYRGAMFPWQSGSDGSEETQVLHLNPLSGEWGDDYSSLQRHVSLAIAYNIFQFYNFTIDLEFLQEYGAEVFLEICRFWASKAVFNQKTQRYDIAGVMGPDEYHEASAGADTGGIKNNTYTNVMVAWAFNRAFDILDFLKDNAKKELLEKINLTNEELNEWRKISDHLQFLLSENNILEQYDGYFKLKEINWNEYADKYGNITRMDRILKAEGKKPDDYKVTKQADTLMVFYNLNMHEIIDLLRQTGLTPSDEILSENFKYYMKNTSHGSTLSKLVHSNLAMQAGDYHLSYDLYLQALKSDYQDVQGGTTKEGIHTGVMAGSAYLALRNYAGLQFEGNDVFVDPNLPAGWHKLSFNVSYRKQNYYFEITPRIVEILNNNSGTKTGAVYVQDEKQVFINNKCVAELSRRSG